jgi:DNA-binding PadR family transcriptional regulator
LNGPIGDNAAMRGRRPGLLPLEKALLEIAIRLDSEGSPEFHGFAAARTLQDLGFPGQLAATGTIYTTLDRLRRGGLLESRWEDSAIGEAEGRPRRRMYRITGAGRSALAEASRAERQQQTAKLAGAEG